MRNEILKHILVIHDDQDLSELVHDDESNGKGHFLIYSSCSLLTSIRVDNEDNVAQ